MARTGQTHPLLHIFVDREGNQVDMAIDVDYVILETYFRGYSSFTDWGQTINGNFYHVVAPRVVLKEEQELLD